MKRIILVVLFVVLATPVWADHEKPVTFAMSGLVSTMVMHAAERTDPTWKNWFVAASIGAAWGVAQNHNNKDEALTGAIAGCMLGKYLWIKYGEEETIAGVTLRW